MKKLDNKGIAISSILYTLLVLLLALIFGVMGIVSSGKTTFDTLKSDVFNKLNKIEKYDESNRFVGEKLQTYTDLLLEGSDAQYTYMGGTYLGGLQDSNYIWYSGNLYRIMGINADGNISLISEGSITSLTNVEWGSGVYSLLESNIDERNITSLAKNSFVYWGSPTLDISNIGDWLNYYFYNYIDGELSATYYCKDPVVDDVFSAEGDCGEDSSAYVTTLSIDEYRLAMASTTYSCNEIGLKLYKKVRESRDAIGEVNDATISDFRKYLVNNGTTCMAYVQDIVSNYEEWGMTATYNEAAEEVYFSTSYLDDSTIDAIWTSTLFVNTLGYVDSSGTFVSNSKYRNNGLSVMPINATNSDIKLLYFSGLGDALYIGGLGDAEYASSNLSFGVRPIITIPYDLVITGGEGTKENPITVDDMSDMEGLKLSSTVSGEYVYLEGRRYRVVEATIEGTKMILDGYLNIKDTYSDMITKMSNNTYLSSLGLSTSDSRLVNYTWDAGNELEDTYDYTDSLAPSSNTFTSYVGGIKIGEMYSAQSDSIALESRKPFWTISNPGWYINDNNTAWISSDDFNSFNVRPAIVISSNVTISGGNGTLESPYEIR